jgi:hypothetical protein
MNCEIDRELPPPPKNVQQKKMSSSKSQSNEEYLCDTLLEKIKTDTSRNLCTFDIIPFINQIMDNEKAIDMLRKRDAMFNSLYRDIVIHRKCNFVNLSVNNDIALSWLFMLYH